MHEALGCVLAGGAFAGPTGKQFEGRVTSYVIVACVVAASGGALFGCAELSHTESFTTFEVSRHVFFMISPCAARYDNGVTGGVISMVSMQRLLLQHVCACPHIIAYLLLACAAWFPGALLPQPCGGRGRRG